MAIPNIHERNARIAVLPLASIERSACPCAAPAVNTHRKLGPNTHFVIRRGNPAPHGAAERALFGLVLAVGLRLRASLATMPAASVAPLGNALPARPAPRRDVL